MNEKTPIYVIIQLCQVVQAKKENFLVVNIK